MDPMHIASKVNPSIRLTLHRIEIIAMLRDGLLEKRIATYLGVSRDTIAEHVGIAMRTLGAHTRAQLVVLALTHGFIELPPPLPDPTTPAKPAPA